jgi:MazG family protein
VPPGLPALLQAATYQRRAARVGFDWPNIEGVRAKVLEEIDEIAALNGAAPAAAGDLRLENELGDLLFAVVNWARWLQIDPEAALRQANARFARRFAHMEAAARAAGTPLDTMTLSELDQLWERAKAEE